MGEETLVDDGASTRLKLNDIRIVGPLLVLLLGAAILINPGFVSADSSVGSSGSTDPCSETVVADASVLGGLTQLCEPECPDLALSATAAGSMYYGCEEPDPCATPAPVPSPAPTTTSFTIFAAEAPADCEPAPGLRIVSPPQPEIIGPTWLGPINATEFGVVTLQFPHLLSIFVGPQGIVRVTDTNGVLVYEGRLGADRTISFPTTGSDTYTVKTVLINRAKYTEVVTPS